MDKKNNAVVDPNSDTQEIIKIAVQNNHVQDTTSGDTSQAATIVAMHDTQPAQTLI